MADSQWNKQFDWGKVIDTANQTGMFNGNRNMAGQQFDWSKQVDQHGMNLADKQFALQQQQAAQRAASLRSTGKPSGSPSGSPGGKVASNPSNLATQFKKEQGQIAQNPADKIWLQADAAVKQFNADALKNTGKLPDKKTQQSIQDMFYKQAGLKNDYLDYMNKNALGQRISNMINW